jgi:hypothetical protein
MPKKHAFFFLAKPSVPRRERDGPGRNKNAVIKQRKAIISQLRISCLFFLATLWSILHSNEAFLGPILTKNAKVESSALFSMCSLIRGPKSLRLQFLGFSKKLHSTTPVMVEGHSVHRVAYSHSKVLVGKRFTASSPNGRFSDGARAIDGKKFHSIEAVGKNLFAFFGENEIVGMVCVHVHFGMSGAWSVFDRNVEEIPPVSPSTTQPHVLDSCSEHISQLFPAILNSTHQSRLPVRSEPA